MGLEKYKEKRDFGLTPEPEGKVEPSPTGQLYIIQKHAASHLHYDLRLELDGVLKSWAVPKGPSLNPGEKRLAVHVEDHPIEYGSFEGLIPKDEYGGGTVMLWDRGRWEPEGDPRRGYEAGNLKFRLFGEKLKGSWVLARMKGDPGEQSKNWLLIKKRDDSAISPGEPEPVETLDRSVASGRSMEEIAVGRDRVWFEGRAVPGGEVPAEKVDSPEKNRRAPVKKSELPPLDPSALPGARPAPQPALFRPELATLVGGPPGGDNWVHEIKHDGYRILCMISGGEVRLVSRNGNDWTVKFAEIARSASGMLVDKAILDGEVVVIGEDGRSDFQALQNIMKGTGTGRVAYFVFDIPHLNGYDLTDTPLLSRKDLLRRLFEKTGHNGQVRYSDHIRGLGPEVFSNACRLALEGIISKQVDSPYEQKRSRRWVKVKCSRRQEFAVGGFTDPGGSRSGFGALLLGYHDPAGNLVYSGKVGTGFNEKSLSDLAGRLTALEASAPPFINPPTGYEARGVHWIRPELVVEVEFAGWTEEGILRHPSYKGLREDKKPVEVVREEPIPPKTASAGKRKPSSPRRKPADDKPAESRKPEEPGKPTPGIALSNPDRVLYPEIGLSKHDLARYYSDVSNWILPHILRRPLTLVRCPEGRQKECFYQKHLGNSAPSELRAIPVMEREGQEFYSVVDNPRGVIGLVQIGVLEIHLWGSREEKLEQPDMMIFDLDPDPAVAWDRMIDAALLLRERLSNLGLTSFLKTTGGKGLHVVVPLTPRADWGVVKDFSRAIAEGIAREFPGEYIATMSKQKRKGKIFIDYLRNGRGATSIAPFSTRARPGAPVSVPLAWEELSDNVRPDTFNVENVRERLASLKKDPWETYFKVRQSITAKMKKQVGLTPKAPRAPASRA